MTDSWPREAIVPGMPVPPNELCCPSCAEANAQAVGFPESEAAIVCEDAVLGGDAQPGPNVDLDARIARFCAEMIEEVQQAIDDGVGGCCGSRRSVPLTSVGDLDVHDGQSDVRLAVGSDGQVLTADSAQSKGVKWADGEEDLYGNGSDGSVSVSSSSATLARDMFYYNLTIEAGGSLDPRGNRIFVKGKLTIAATGKIQSNGGAGAAGSGGTGGAAGSAGGGTTRVPWASLGRAGGAGGSGGGSGTFNGNGSTGGAAIFPPMDLLIMLAGCGGGGGGGHGAAPTNGGEAGNNWGATGADGGNGSGAGSANLGGGGGGGGGGVVAICAREIDNAGSIEAKGGAGGAGESSGGNSAGNGSGGGGGAVIVTYTTASGSGLGTLSAAGGAAGAGGSGGAAGSAGSTASYQVSW